VAGEATTEEGSCAIAGAAAEDSRAPQASAPAELSHNAQGAATSLGAAPTRYKETYRRVRAGDQYTFRRSLDSKFGKGFVAIVMLNPTSGELKEQRQKLGLPTSTQD
jgi:hypothetical protein